ncbi:alpha/beta hydrolase [Chitinophaga nivalis]|uniref:Alpha/beta hydrolase-fold protein n=1 Tax=Chitinophaga nivalis TaxID=2991709 RepID=A0ABT3IK32_9BACT|nr:alpha/beta hydrolase-fold protein [Chitinophaga nivalis]MCW3465986.1 alpha/beta hydrolase-fold protein [Chitinophaga nivalis]MCW3484323.1 alpha/beta hydrolase-fold protein [Chitinophaga nivalis]
MIKRFFTGLVLLAMISQVSKGQQAVPVQRIESSQFQLGIIDKIPSARLGENRTLNIYLPDAYKKDTTTAYPVIYLLDGSEQEDFIHIVGLVNYMNMINVLPPTIVVGIANVDRRRDFTFPTQNIEDQKAWPTTGKSEKFISFLEQELQPYITQHYRTTAEKTLIGQSLGGLLATEILLKKPQLFRNYIIVSPSLWWNDESLLAEAPVLMKMHPYKENIQAYLALGTEGAQMQRDMDALLKIFREKGDKKLKLTYVPFPEENHLTILHRSVYKAFEVLNKK